MPAKSADTGAAFALPCPFALVRALSSCHADDTPVSHIMRRGVVKYDQVQTTYFGLNTKKGPADDVQVRRAIGHAINRDERMRQDWGDESGQGVI